MTATTAPAADVPLALPTNERVRWVTSLPFFAVHGMALLAFVVPFRWQYVWVCVGLYYFRMWALTTGYHRYFSHRTFKTSRVFQFILAFCACLCTQKGPLWWAAHHRHHHRYSDQEEDVHSPLQRGFWWSHVGWILCDRYNETRYDAIKDFAKYPELRLLNRFYLVPPVALAVALFFIGGFPLLVWGFFVSTTLLWHGTFTINSLSHVFGRRRFKTSDTSRNNWLLALITCGEGWHNNHHYHQNTANQGWFWWEFDPSYYVLRGLAVLRIVSDVRTPPEAVKYAYRRYSPEDQAELRATPALFGSGRRAMVHAARRAVQRASELQLSGPSPAPVLRR
jgi:stearoyl-CoA desaturase (delta-9 desaturase)